MSMTSLMQERDRYVLALTPQAVALAPGGVVSWFVRMGECAKLIFVALLDTLADGEAVVCTVVEAVDAAGTGAQNIATAAATATAGVAASRVQLTMQAPAIGNAVTITVGGVAHVFTAAAAQNLVTHAFDQSAGNNAAATSLAACINSALYGIAGVTATAVGPTVVLTVNETGAYTITVATATPLVIVPVTLETVVLVEVDASALTPGFNHVALRVSGPVTANAGVIAVQGALRRRPPTQPVAAQAWDF